MKLYGDKELEIEKDKQFGHSDIILTVANDKESGPIEMLRLCSNGDIFVKGNLAKNDLEVVEALKEFLIEAKRIKHD